MRFPHASGPDVGLVGAVFFKGCVCSTCRHRVRRVRPAALRRVVLWRAITDADGQVASNDGRRTDRPSTMPRLDHTAHDQAHTDAGGACSLGHSGLTLTADGMHAGDVGEQRCRSHAAFRRDRTQRRPWFVVNPGEGMAGASGFMAATVRPNKFPRPAVFLAQQISWVSRSSTALRSQAMQPARPSPFGSPTRPRWARP